MNLKFVVFIYIVNSQTTTNTCTNDPQIFKLDIRQRIQDIGNQSTISNINLQQLCDETQTYDYIWLTQLWIPSKFNYKNFTVAEQTFDYRDFETIKEYQFDPILGTQAELVNFIKGFKQICIHMKFLGEFSFYIGQDSSLLSDKTRFLRRPQNISYNDQNQRYDDKGLVWAINSQGKTLPYTAVWNYFQYAIFKDIKDILENQIIKQYSLDGVVFLQPSLGLFEVANAFYPLEIDSYGDAKFMGDFYLNYNLKDSNTNLYFMGDVDNIRAKRDLLSVGLKQTYNPSPTNVWMRYNYTFDDKFCHSSVQVTDLRAFNPALTSLKHCTMDIPFSQSKQCIKYNFTVLFFQNIKHIQADYYSGTLAGIGNYQALKNMGFIQSGLTPKKNIFAMVANGVMSNYLGQESNRDVGVGFQIYKYDIFEIQFDGSNNEMFFRKTNSSLFRYQQLDVLYSQYRFIVGVYNSGSNIEVAFPYQFTDDLKSSNLQINGDRHIESIKNNTKLQIGQVLQSINQYENNTTLNINALNIPSQSILAVGICNKDLMILNKHQIVQNINGGGYMLLSNGSILNYNQKGLKHSTDPAYNNQTFSGFIEGNTISITFTRSNYSVTFKKNNLYINSMSLGQYVKNLHFCVGFYQEFQSVNLQY